MPSLRDFRSNFAAGRTGEAISARPDAQSYQMSVYDARNFMITSDNIARRRWGTELMQWRDAAERLETWVVSESDDMRFLLAFSPGRLEILDGTLASRAVFEDMPWTESTMWFLTIGAERYNAVIADASFRTQILAFDTAAGTFSMEPFDFDTSGDERYYLAPFFAFDKEVKCSFTTLTAPGVDTALAAALESILGTEAGEFDLAAGTGTVTTDQDVFTDEHVGLRMKIADGEFVVDSVAGPREASISVIRDIAIALDDTPFWCVNGSNIVEVSCEDHGLKVGDQVVFFNLQQDTATEVLHGALYLEYSNTTDRSNGTPCAYTVKRVVDENFFCVEGEGTASSTDLAGGNSVKMMRFWDLPGLREPVFSPARGWPQAAGFHETRLWLGGSVPLPDAAFASAPGSMLDFDPGTGEADDAVTMYGIGDQSRVRHFVSSFDLAILTDRGAYYVPGSTERAITQETVRAPKAADGGAAYTKPFLFDTAFLYVDANGASVREMSIQGDDSQYYIAPISTVVSDWINAPRHTARYDGAADVVTPYLIWSNSDDGGAVVMHSNRADQAMGFMRWDIEGASFASFAGLSRDLYASVELDDGRFALVRFDTEGRTTLDLAERLTGSATDEWVSQMHADETLAAHSGLLRLSDVELDGAGAFFTADTLDELWIGSPMPYELVAHTPIAASGQGPQLGNMVRLVSADILWSGTWTGTVGGQEALSALDFPALEVPTPISEWRKYMIGEWGTAPRLAIEGSAVGEIAVRAMVLKVYF
ncbi:hypothetical protein [Poseidonocella sp. HB161398]|uniref:hypothetical protein n=1 Tax=Poseidonocella sp. HB161398 TaxID=2320855 RepID=UPI0011084A96|nr:hypothetical protein [Poseidonocella sp. HB161398]